MRKTGWEGWRLEARAGALGIAVGLALLAACGWWLAGHPAKRARPAETGSAAPIPAPRRAYVPPMPATRQPPPQPQFDAEIAMAHVVQLAERIGKRDPGSEGEKRARVYVRDTLESYGYDVQIQTFAIWDGMSSGNVIAKRGPAVPSLIIGAHLDSMPVSPGANDNASGVAVLLELARRLAGDPSAANVWFVAFGTEEGRYSDGGTRSIRSTGRRGSRHFVDALTDNERLTLKAMLNMDMVGAGDALDIGDMSEQGEPPARRCLQIAKELGLAARFDQFGGQSDYRPFHDRGIPIIAFAWGTHPSHHTPGDVVGLVEPAKMQAVYDVVARCVEEQGRGEEGKP
ncbi:MAG: M28 family peptidase [Armatimonadetes bacterium]|nr:M28 family peptidase [Armatimonadota bacterium]